MDQSSAAVLFNQAALDKLFPKERSNDFFEALFGDPSEGAYDISLSFEQITDSEIIFHLNLNQRPGSCLVCSLTHGLPNVFSRHPIINIQGVVDGIDELLGENGKCGEWQLQGTIGNSSELHIIPLSIKISA